MLMSGLPVDADRALAVRLVNRVVDDAAAVTSAIELATAIAANSPQAVRATKRTLAITLDTTSRRRWSLNRSRRRCRRRAPMPPRGGRPFGSGVHQGSATESTRSSEAVGKRLSFTYVEGTVRLLAGQRGVGSRAQTCEA